MSVNLIANSIIKAPLLINWGAAFIQTSSQILNQPFATTVNSPDGEYNLVRVNLAISAPWSATGQSALILVSATDPDGNVRSVSTTSIGAGGFASQVGVLIAVPGAQLYLSVQAAQLSTFLSTCNYSLSLETL